MDTRKRLPFRSKDSDTGDSGLTIPALSESATDMEVLIALTGLSALQEQLKAQLDALEQDAETQIDKMLAGSGLPQGTAPVNAEIKSEQVREELSTIKVSLTNSFKRLGDL